MAKILKDDSGMSNKKVQISELYEFYKELDRSFFIDNQYKEYAHYDQPLPIGFGATISQPSLVLEMTLALELNKDCSVLEIGTGSGYQTAFLARFARQVFTIERIAELSCQAQRRLTQLGYKNIHFKIGDGSEGWREHAPYQRIMVTAGAEVIPQELLKQLKKEGIMVIPVGVEGQQELFVVSKDHYGQLTEHSLGHVKFVELKGKYGWSNRI